ncbi:unnamed protein product [Dicrocoelium dendriticum]|nr:unnamed protein product [Dicrocoelium dendriticum]
MRKPLLQSYKTLGIIAINVLFCVAIIFLSLLSLFSGRRRKKKNANDNYPYVKVPT